MSHWYWTTLMGYPAVGPQIKKYNKWKGKMFISKS